MKIVLTGGGTGGHFYPIIAVAEAIDRVAREEHFVMPELFYISDSPYDPDLLLRARLRFIQISSGKIRTYSSGRNLFDKFLTLIACFKALVILFRIYPDVVFGKGGYASFPTIFAARVLRIPVVIHESDISLGRVNSWVVKYASRVAVSYPETLNSLPHRDRGALTGIPIRKDMLEPMTEDPFELLKLERGLPTLLILGGSQGSERINEIVMDIMPQLVENYQVIHQTGKANIEWMKKRAEGALTGNPYASRYHPYAYMDGKTLRAAASASTLVISRAGSSIFEIALWKKPSILIPLPIARGDHQRENAYSYARTGAATVIEEANLKPGLLRATIDSIAKNPELQKKMADATSQFARTDAAEKIAHALLAIAQSHES
jgi:UDP-N-acetylglucosamine--N-acetylmuramyl-(pentapeptide) pyrophosphoryl-undecaprenol N-acetylglucosamine transferase